MKRIIAGLLLGLLLSPTVAIAQGKAHKTVIHTEDGDRVVITGILAEDSFCLDYRNNRVIIDNRHNEWCDATRKEYRNRPKVSRLVKQPLPHAADQVAQ